MRALPARVQTRRRPCRSVAAFLAAAGALGLAASGLGASESRAAGAAKPAAAALPPASDSRHYLTNELEVRPGIMVRVQPAYPARAARENISGKAIVNLYIDANGGVERVTVERATPAGYGFDDSAARAFRAARFSPGMKDGKQVPVQMRIEVSFEAPPAASGATKR